jgi:hypothetical protein
MLIPQFSIRFLFLLMAALAPLFLLFSFGTQGSRWAAAIGIGFAALVGFFLLQAALFGLVWLLSLVTRRGNPHRD